jgi:hypothetical protein
MRAVCCAVLAHGVHAMVLHARASSCECACERMFACVTNCDIYKISGHFFATVLVNEPSFGLDKWNLTDNHSFNSVRGPSTLDHM